jgi:hypothetical protein
MHGNWVKYTPTFGQTLACANKPPNLDSMLRILQGQISSSSFRVWVIWLSPGENETPWVRLEKFGSDEFISILNLQVPKIAA